MPSSANEVEKTDSPAEVPQDGVFTLTRETFTQLVPSRRYEYVDVPEWKPGARARIQNLNSSEVSAYESSNWKGNGAKMRIDLQDAEARLVCFGMVDENGVRVLNPKEADDVRKVGRMDSGPVKRIAKAIRKLSDMNTEEDEGDGEEGN